VSFTSAPAPAVSVYFPEVFEVVLACTALPNEVKNGNTTKDSVAASVSVSLTGCEFFNRLALPTYLLLLLNLIDNPIQGFIKLGELNVFN